LAVNLLQFVCAVKALQQLRYGMQHCATSASARTAGATWSFLKRSATVHLWATLLLFTFAQRNLLPKKITKSCKIYKSPKKEAPST
jgi:hypothetical protein